MKKKVLVLDNYDSFTYNLVHYIESNGDYEAVVFRNDEIILDEVASFDTIVLSPGPGLPENAGILKAVIKTYAPTKKILGVCLGMQAIAEVFGGQLENLESVKHGVSRKLTVCDKDDQLFKGLPSIFRVGRYHSWVVSNMNFPKDLIVTAKDENNHVMALKHTQYQLFGVQFHPESVLTEHGQLIIDHFLGVV